MGSCGRDRIGSAPPGAAAFYGKARANPRMRADGPRDTMGAMGGYFFLIAATAGWLAFGWVLATRPVLLDEMWAAVRSLPLAAKPLVWIAFLPWLAGLAAWESNWGTRRVRLIVVLVIAAAWITFWAASTSQTGARS
jgi:hypothetical protein